MPMKNGKKMPYGKGATNKKAGLNKTIKTKGSRRTLTAKGSAALKKNSPSTYNRYTR